MARGMGKAKILQSGKINPDDAFEDSQRVALLNWLGKVFGSRDLCWIQAHRKVLGFLLIGKQLIKDLDFKTKFNIPKLNISFGLFLKYSNIHTWKKTSKLT